MHQSVLDFIAKTKGMLPEYFTRRKVHEIGSLNINGSPRQFFTDCDYTGFDLGTGPDVDIVLHYADQYIYSGVDVVISCEALEHDRRWQDTVNVMYKQLKSVGLMVITCATCHRGPHGVTDYLPEESPYTNDHYEGISPLDFMLVISEFDLAIYSLIINEMAGDLQFAAIKR